MIKFGFMNVLVREFICNKVIKELSEIKVIAGECRYNYQCHKNSAHVAEINGDDFLVVCIYIDDNFPIIHFLNYDSINGEYVDNTLGIHTSMYKHYLWKKVHKKDFYKMDNVFFNLRQEITKSLPWYLRLFSDYRC